MNTDSPDTEASDLGPNDPPDVLYNALRELSVAISSARGEIKALRPKEMKQHILTSATDELDEIVKATADATNSIMDATEEVEAVLGDVDAAVADKLTSATTSIYEACSFQDITGQRVTKVVNLMRQIETRVDALIESIGDDHLDDGLPSSDDEVKDDSDLMNGPQMPSQAVSQDDIDALFDD